MNERTFLASNAHWLDDPARLTWMPPREVVSALELKAGMMIADIGCGTGYFAIPFAREVAPDGHVFAVDMQPGMLEILGKKSRIEGAPSNISLHDGEAISTGLAANSCDLVFLGNIWHELDHALAVLNEARRILHPGGRIAILTGVQMSQIRPVRHLKIVLPFLMQRPQWIVVTGSTFQNSWWALTAICLSLGQ